MSNTIDIPEWVNKHLDRQKSPVDQATVPKEPNYVLRRIGVAALILPVVGAGTAALYEFNGPKQNVTTITQPMDGNGPDTAFNKAVNQAEKQNAVRFINNNIFIDDALGNAEANIAHELKAVQNPDGTYPSGTTISVTTSKGPLFGIPFVEGHAVLDKSTDQSK